jgi:hypothetical protein
VRFGQTLRPRVRKGEARAKGSAKRVADDDLRVMPNEQHFDRSKSGRREGRQHISNEIRRELIARDGLRCSYGSEDGRRCASSAFLQIHHDQAWAKGGPDTTDNLRLLCAAHSQMLAEEEYGATHVTSAIARQRDLVPTGGGYGAGGG